jgi:hypothetical protein
MKPFPVRGILEKQRVGVEEWTSEKIIHNGDGRLKLKWGPILRMQTRSPDHICSMESMLILPYSHTSLGGY